MFKELLSIIFYKDEVEETPVMQIADKLSVQDYKVMLGVEEIGMIKLVGNEWIFQPFTATYHKYTADEIYQIYDRINELNCDL